jgi:acyl carrier protein
VDNVELYQKLTQTFRDVFDDEELILTPQLSADDVEDWDSLKHVRLVLSVEREFNVRFSSAEVTRLKNVGDLASLISSKVS